MLKIIIAFTTAALVYLFTEVPVYTGVSFLILIVVITITAQKVTVLERKNRMYALSSGNKKKLLNALAKTGVEVSPELLKYEWLFGEYTYQVYWPQGQKDLQDMIK